MWRPTWLLAGLVASLVGACLLTTHLPEVGTAAGGQGGVGGGGPTGGGSTSTGGVGGAGGGAGGSAGGQGGEPGTRAADWTSSFQAVLRFEKPSPDLGFDSTGKSAFQERGTPTLDVSRFVEGAASMGVNDDGLERAAPFPDASFTMGGWFYMSDPLLPGDVAFVFAVNGLAGFSLERGDTGKVECFAGNGVVESGAGTESMNLNTWMHVVCAYDTSAGALANYTDGILRDSTPAAYSPAAAPLEIPDNGQGFVGNMDEVFFHADALSPTAITRIFACGIDGSECRCHPDNPATYIDCGRVNDCGVLPACDLAAP